MSSAFLNEEFSPIICQTIAEKAFPFSPVIKQLDDIETENEANAALLGFENEEKIFGPDQQNYRWSKFKNLAPAVQFQLMQEEIFPFIKTLHPDDDASYTRFMKDATFQISALCRSSP